MASGVAHLPVISQALDFGEAVGDFTDATYKTNVKYAAMPYMLQGIFLVSIQALPLIMGRVRGLVGF